MKPLKIIEFNDALFIGETQIPYVIKDSISIEDGVVSLKVFVSSYERIFKEYGVDPKELYNYHNNLPD